MDAERSIVLGWVPAGRVHPEETTDRCIVEVIAQATGGSARSLVRCLFTRRTAHVPAAAVR